MAVVSIKFSDRLSETFDDKMTITGYSLAWLHSFNVYILTQETVISKAHCRRLVNALAMEVALFRHCLFFEENFPRSFFERAILAEMMAPRSLLLLLMCLSILFPYSGKLNAEQTETPEIEQTTSQEEFGIGKALRPELRQSVLPRTRWQHRPNHALWTRSALAALNSHGAPLLDLIPGDVATWCPAYIEASKPQRSAFWVGFLSALAKYESTYKETAVGGGGKWFGLLQIAPATARGYGCAARSGQALKSGAANLSCAIRIMSVTVPRDRVIHGYKRGKGQGVTADWGPMHSSRKRREMADWLRSQSYCKPINDTRPRSRP